MMQLTQNRVAGSRILRLGVLLAALMAAWLVLAAWPAHAATTFTANSTGDKEDQTSGDGKCFTGDVLVVQGDECTLRAAIEEANETPGADTINFDIPGTGVNTISPVSELPEIADPVAIDGYSQPGAKPNTLAAGNDAVLKIELSGASAGSGQGLQIGATNSTVRGLVINRWDDGITIRGSGATSNKVIGNYIGTDASGTQDLGNSFEGVSIYDALNNTIGGTQAGERNVISANNGHGVLIAGIGNGATGNKVMGNYVGTDRNGAVALGNSFDGVLVSNARNNTIGGTTAATRNVISANGSDGVRILANSVTGNRVLSNSIFSNGELGIDLGGDGVTPNDTGDADSGPNDLQNFPVLTSAKTVSGKTTIRSTLNSTSNTTFTLQFFSSPTPNPSGFGEGKKLIGQKSVTTNKKGNASFEFVPNQAVPVGYRVTATATNGGGDTSEFSRARIVVRPI